MGAIKININTIVNYINERLAGEQLLYSQLLVFLDGTIDDINQALNSYFILALTLYGTVEYSMQISKIKVTIDGEDQPILDIKPLNSRTAFTLE